MRYPQLRTDGRSSNGTYKVTNRDMIQAFRGYNHNLRIDDDEFYFTENVSLDLYPVLSQRKSRGILNIEADGGIFAAEKVCRINGRKLYYGDTAIKSDLSEDLIGVQRQFAQMGAHIVIFPDKIWFNSADETISVVSLESDFESTGTVTYTLCDIDGRPYNAPSSPTAPASPANGDYWIDTSSVPYTLKQWSESMTMWATIPTTYIKVFAYGIGNAFEADDVVEFSGSDVTDLNGTYQIYKTERNYIITTGIIDTNVTQQTALTVRRDVPDIDYITESNNRLWGCSSKNHEIYASKLGDPTNWRSYQGLVSDSYAATIGSAGPFTGAATLGGNVLFFKADCFHKVYGSQPSNYQVIEVTARGVQQGSARSLAIVNEVLYYLSRDGICAYDGSLPVSVSRAFGQEKYSNGVAGSVDGKYYVSLKDMGNVWHLFVLDTEKGMWVREDNTHADCFTYYDGDLYYTESGSMKCVKGSQGTAEEPFEWIIESGDIGLNLADQKYVTRIVMRMEIPTGGYAALYVSYDDEHYDLKERLYSQGLDSVYAAIQPRRCDHMRIKLVGLGGFKLYSISKTVEQGSEINGRL